MKNLLLLLLFFICVSTVSAQQLIDRNVKPQNKMLSERQWKQQLIGTWNLVLVDNINPDGKRTQPYGENPQGILMFDKDGNYALQILRTDRVNFVSGDKTKGTADENRALVLGGNSHFGKYLINAADNTITFQIEHAFFPNWQGTEQKRNFTLSEKEFRYTVPTTTNGAGVSGEVVWKKGKRLHRKAKGKS
jgi:hypothetical protein